MLRCALQANTFVAAFYDAVLLYADALNRTLSDGYNATDGDQIKLRMWNRTFPSIAGNAIIDKNGDRHADYSLLDYNPESGQFEVLCYCHPYFYCYSYCWLRYAIMRYVIAYVT